MSVSLAHHWLPSCVHELVRDCKQQFHLRLNKIFIIIIIKVFGSCKLAAGNVIDIIVTFATANSFGLWRSLVEGESSWVSNWVCQCWSLTISKIQVIYLSRDLDSSSSGSSRTHASIGSRIHFAHGAGWNSGMWQNPWRRNQFMARSAESRGFAAQFREPYDEPDAASSYPWGKSNFPRFGMTDGGLSGRPNYRDRHTPYYYADRID